MSNEDIEILGHPVKMLRRIKEWKIYMQWLQSKWSGNKKFQQYIDFYTVRGGLDHWDIRLQTKALIVVT